MNNVTKFFVLTLIFSGLATAAAESGAGPRPQCDSPQLIATLPPSTGLVRVVNPNSTMLFTTIEFKNTGSAPVTISHVRIVSNGAPISATVGGMGFEVNASQTISMLFSNYNPVPVDQIEFEIDDAATSLQIYGVNCSGPEPGGFSGGN